MVIHFLEQYYCTGFFVLILKKQDSRANYTKSAFDAWKLIIPQNKDNIGNTYSTYDKVTLITDIKSYFFVRSFAVIYPNKNILKLF